MEETDSEVTRLTIRPVQERPEEDKNANRHYYHTMVQFLNAVFIYLSVFAAITILSMIVWGAFVLTVLYIIGGIEPILNTVF
jgi:hypothetical protein